MRGVLVGAALAVLATTAVNAAQLVTDGAAYAGPVIDIGAVPDPGYYFTNAPQTFGNITVSGDNIFDTTVYGKPYYGFGAGGGSQNATIIATGMSNASLFIDFANPVAVFGAGMNYDFSLDPFNFPYPVLPASISAFDSDGDLIARFDLETVAPIRTGGLTDAFSFRGIDGQGRGISRFVVTGSYIGILLKDGQLVDGPPPPPPPTVPEPATWLMLVLGFGAVGGIARRRSARPA